jgi:hypothetical protein
MGFSYRLRRLLIRLGFLTINRNYGAAIEELIGHKIHKPALGNNRQPEARSVLKSPTIGWIERNPIYTQAEV